MMYYAIKAKNKNQRRWLTSPTNDFHKRLIRQNREFIRAALSRGETKIISYNTKIGKSYTYSRERYFRSGPGRNYLKSRMKHLLPLTW